MFGKTFSRALTLATVLSLVMTSVVFADNVQNDVVASGPSDTKIVTITAGDTTGATVGYQIHATSGDSTDTTGRLGNNCNAADGSPAVVTPTGLPTGATASPSSLSFTVCDVEQTTTFTAAATTVPGDYLITVGVSDSEAVSGDYNTSPGTFTLRVVAGTPSDTTAPTVTSIDRPAGAENPTNDASVSWTVTFSESVTGVDASDFSLAATGVTGASITGVTGSGSTYTVTANTGTGSGSLGLNLVDNDSIVDGAGNKLGGTNTATTGDGSFTGQVYTIDKSAPAITLSTDDTANATTTWFNIASDTGSDGIQLTASATDASGVASLTCTNNSAAFISKTASPSSSPLSDTKVLANGTNAVSCTATDALGNTTDPAVTGSYSVDLVRPAIADNGPTTSANTAGWYKTAVTNTFTASDDHSGIPATFTPNPFTKTTTGEGEGIKVNSGPVTDVAGNTNNGRDSAAFNIDLTDPEVAITAPASGLTTIATSVTVSGTATDSPSGIASVTLNGGTNAYSGNGTFSQSFALACGVNTIEALATDVAGRTDTDSITVTRICFTGLQYYQPLDQTTAASAAPVINAGKYGRVIPVKVTLSVLGGAAVTDATLAANGWTLQIGVNGASCTGGTATDAVEAYADAGTANSGTNHFRWDSTSQQWIYNLDTKSPPGMTMTINNCYRLDVYISDGTNKVKVSTTTYAIFKPVK